MQVAHSIEGFIVETKVSTARDDTKATFYVRDDNYHTHAVTIDHPHLSVSKELDKDVYEPENTFIHLRRKFPNFDFQIIDLSKSKYVFHAYGPRNLRHNLPGEIFYVKDSLPDGRSPEFNSPTRHLRFKHPPGSIVEIIQDAIIDTGRRVSLERLLSEKSCAIDVELENWRGNNPSILTAILYTGDPATNKVFTLLDPKQDIILDTAVVLCKDQNDLVSKLAQAEIEHGALWIFGHYIPNDKRWLRDLTEEELYEPGVDHTRPIVKYAKRMGKTEDAKIRTIKMITPGRLTVDTYGYGKNNFGFLIDDRLVTHFARTGESYKKIISYDDLEKLTEQARMGDYEAARVILQYTVEDGQKTFLLGQRMMKNVARKLIALGIDADTLSSKSRNSLANDYWKKNTFEKRGTYREVSSFVKSKIFREGNPETLDKESVEQKVVKILTRNGLSAEDKQNGAFENVHAYYPTPLIQAFGQIIKQKRGLKEIYDALRAEKDPDLRFDLARTLNSHLIVPFLEIEFFLRKSGRIIGDYIDRVEYLEGNPGADFAFGKTYGLSSTQFGMNTNYWQMNQNIFYAVQGYYGNKGLLPGLKEANIINFNKDFFFVKKREPLKDSESTSGAIYLGECNLVSSEDRMVANLGSSLIYQGFAKGGKTNSRPAMLLVHRALRNHFSGMNSADNYSDFKNYFSELQDERDSGEIGENTWNLFGGVLEAVMPKKRVRNLLVDYKQTEFDFR